MNDRIVRVPVTQLELWPGNPRTGNIDVLCESIRANGIYKPLLVQMSTGRVLAGNNLLIAAQRMGIREVDVIYHDVDDEGARRILLVDNRSSDLGGYDEDALREVLASLTDMTGTGYHEWDEDVAALLAAAEDNGLELLDTGELNDDEIDILEEVPVTGASWAELPQQEAARAERQAAQVPRATAGTREIMLVYLLDEHEEMIRMLDGLRRTWGGDLRNPQIVQRLVRKAAREAGIA